MKILLSKGLISHSNNSRILSIESLLDNIKALPNLYKTAIILFKNTKNLVIDKIKIISLKTGKRWLRIWIKVYRSFNMITNIMIIPFILMIVESLNNQSIIVEEAY